MRAAAFLFFSRVCWVITLACGVSCSSTEKKAVALTDFRLETLEGRPMEMEAFRGKRVFINVWATWCGPCVKEMPTIAEAMKQVQDSSVVFLFASPEEAEEINVFRERRKFPFTYVRLVNLEALSINALPTTYVFDTDGTLVYGEEGFRDWSTPENVELIKSSVR